MKSAQNTGDETPHVVALVAVHNRLALTQRCLATLWSQSEACRLDIILVDDGSTDGTGEWLREHEPSVHVLRGDGSLWFGGALQWALQEAKRQFPECDYILTVNNDTFFRPGALREMIDASEGEASVGAAFWIEDRATAGSSGFVWHWRRGPLDVVVTKAFRHENKENSRRFLPVDVLATTATLFPAKYCFAVKGIDVSRHPHNRADVCLTSQIKRAGASAVVSSAFLADHLYGPFTQRHSIRRLTMADFWWLSFVDRKSPANLTMGIIATWTTAPTRMRAIPVIANRLAIFFRQFLMVLASRTLRLRPKA